jgi:hypothetical protein
MKNMEGRNQLAERVAPGIWRDTDGNVHFSIPELLDLAGLEHTPQNRALVTEMGIQILMNADPSIQIVKRGGFCPHCRGEASISAREERGRGDFVCVKCGKFCKEEELVE